MKFLRYVGRWCRESAYASALADNEVAVLDTSRDRGNVTLFFRRYGLREGPLAVTMDAGTRDLLDLAAVIYIADEIAPRGEAWSRDLGFSIPVAAFDSWTANENALSALLEFLTGDTYSFTWMKSQRLPRYGNHRIHLPVGTYDSVCLFSGGLDSLMGAISLLEDGNRVLLVGHRTEGVTSVAQRDLFRELQFRYDDQVEMVQCTLSRSRRAQPRFELPDKVEDSHRSRSFLFLALGIAIARASRTHRLILAENGLIALNPPLGRSRVGSLSTRTAHPRYLANFVDFVRQLRVFDGDLTNPFLYLSKTDIVENLAEWQIPLVLRSVSCAHAATGVRWEGRAGVSHCGYCVPCIYRRVALMNAGLDRPQDYCADVFRDLHNLTPTRREDMQLLTRFARSVSSSDAVGLRSLVVSHGTFPASVGEQIGPQSAPDFTPWAEMLSRWASRFLGLLDEHSTAATKRLLSYSRSGIGRRNL